MNIINFLKPKSEVAYIFDDFTVRQTLEKMQAHRYAAIPIIGKTGKYVGTITEGDLLWFIKSNLFLDLKKAEDLPILTVARKSDNQAVYISAEIGELYRLSLQQNFIPILDDRDMFIGIVTRSDLLTHFQRSPENKSETAYEAILGRRSIRRWENTPIAEEVVYKIIAAGLAAPSAHNRQPIHIVHIDNPELREKLLDATFYGKKVKNSPQAFAIFGDTFVETDAFLLNNDASATIENMLLAIHALQLGGVWVGAASSEWRSFVNQNLAVPEQYQLFGMIAYGHSFETKSPHLTYNSIKIHTDTW